MPDQLRELGLASVTELRAFLDSQYFKPFFEIYAQKWIYPQQKECLRTGSARKRGPDLVTVESRLIVGERPGSNKYSFAFPDKSDWDHADHLAYLLFHVRITNEKSSNGLFFGKSYSESFMNNIIWSLIKMEEYRHAPTRQKHTPGSTQPDTTENDTKDGEVVEDNPIEDNPTEETATKTKEAFVEVKTEVNSDQEEESAVLHNQLIKFVRRHDGDDVPRAPVPEPEHNGTVEQQLIETQRLIMESTSSQINLSERFWKIVVIDKVIQSESAEAFRTNLDIMNGLENVPAYESQAVHHRFTKDIEADTIEFQPFTDSDRIEFEQQEKWLDNLDYQREDVKASCDLLQIRWEGDNTVYRMPGMPVSVQLRYWQPVAIKALVGFQADTRIRACILGDIMGLGKTWELIGYLLWWVNTWISTPQENRVEARPHLILMPRSLITQWIREFDKIAPGKFTIYKYFGDQRPSRHRPVASEKTVSGLLTPQHEVFGGSETVRVRTIIISSYGTWTERHGPGKLKKFRTNQYGMSDFNSTRLYREADSSWPYNLEGIFEHVICDEAQHLRDSTTKSSIAVQWLKARFHILASATPIPNGISDWYGYMAFIEPSNADALWTDQSLESMGIDEFTNPFDLNGKHPGAILRFTQRGVRDFINRTSIPDIVKSQRLNLIWKDTMLRRNLSSRIPFEMGPKIGEQLPYIKSAFIECNFTPDEIAQYHDQYETILLSMKKGKSWSLGVQRKLCLMTMNLRLIALDERHNLRANNQKSILENESFYLDWFEQDGSLETNIPQLIHSLCWGAPKLRGFLRNIRSQTIRDREKALVFCQFPASSILIFAVLKMLQLPATILASYHHGEDRDKIVEGFNFGQEPMILIMTYAVGSTGLNLQYKCHRIHLLESSYNLGIFYQAIGRVRRLGNPWDVVFLYEYYVKDTIDDVRVAANIEKAIPQMMAEINRAIFSSNDETQGVIDIGDWVFYNEKLMKLEEALERYGAHNDFEILGPSDILRHILLLAKGEVTSI